MDQADQLRKIVKKQIPHMSARVITVTSGKGGVGKSTTAVNLAIQMSRLGKKVVIFDADFGLANVEVMLGVRPEYTLADLIFRGKELGDIITVAPGNIGFISGGSGIQELAYMSREQIIYLIQKLVQLDSFADIILVDTGAGISDSVLEFVASSTEVLLVVTPEPTSITDVYALLKALHRKANFSTNSTKIQMVSNKIGSEQEGLDIYNKLKIVTEKFLDIEFEYLGGIPQDKNMSKAVMLQKPVLDSYPTTSSALAIKELTSKLCNNEIEITKEKRGIAKLFANLLTKKNKMS